MLSVRDNRIRSRRYDLTIYKDGEIVGHESYLSAREKNELTKEYHREGKTVRSDEVFSLTKNAKVIGDNPIKNSGPEKTTRYTPRTVEATEKKIQLGREKSHAKAIETETRKLNKNGKNVYRTGMGEDKNSPLHKMYLKALRRNGYKVFNKKTREFFYGFQKETSEYIYNL